MVNAPRDTTNLQKCAENAIKAANHAPVILPVRNALKIK